MLAVRMEDRTNMMSCQAVSQKRSGEGRKGNSMTLDWFTQRNGLSHAELGVLRDEAGSLVKVPFVVC